jgi:hypothetical protein
VHAARRHPSAADHKDTPTRHVEQEREAGHPADCGAG